MCDEVLTLEMAQSVSQFHELDEKVMFRVELRSTHRALEVEGQPFLDTLHPASPGKIHEERKVKHYGRCQYAVSTEKNYKNFFFVFLLNGSHFLPIFSF